MVGLKALKSGVA